MLYYQNGLSKEFFMIFFHLENIAIISDTWHWGWLWTGFEPTGLGTAAVRCTLGWQGQDKVCMRLLTTPLFCPSNYYPHLTWLSFWEQMNSGEFWQAECYRPELMSHVFGAFPNGLSLFLPERERQLRSVKEAFLWEFTGVERRLSLSTFRVVGQWPLS